jgi:subtilisin family serine protease
MLQFPPSFSPQRRTPSHSLSQLFRHATAIGLAALLFLAPLSFRVSAQQQSGQPVDSQHSFEIKADKLLKIAYSEAVKEAQERSSQQPGQRPLIRTQIDDLANIVALRRKPDGTISIGVIVELTGNNADELKAAGFSVGSSVGNIVTIETDINRMPELAALASVQKLYGVTFRRPLNDRARQSVGIDNSAGQRVVSQTGRGVVVGIIDSGVDFRHPDFTVPNSNGLRTRIKAMLDMTVYTSTAADWNYQLPGGSGTIGHLYTESDINAALQQSSKPSQSSDIVKERDSNGHGTHVTGTAAGNGLGSPTPGVYAGMAPEADLVIVKASRQNDGNASFRGDDDLNALNFIKQKAAELGEPFVINMSLGGQAGPHDGTDPEEVAIDSLVNGGAGRAVCVAAGNEGSDSIHASTTVPASGAVTLHFNANSNPSFIDLYSSPRGTSSSGRYTVTLTEPDGTTLGPLAFNANGFSQANGQLSDSSVQLWDALDNKGTTDTSDDQADVFMVFKSAAKKGTWTITLTNGSGQSASTFDAWAEGDDVNFADFVDNNSHLVGSPGTSRGAITVGAFVTRSATQTIDDYAFFTSPGPTADGRQKPDISAPGYYLYSSKSSDINSTNGITSFSYGTGSNALASGVDANRYGGLAGTSMSTPVTTGSVALLLQANASLTNSQIKSAITSTAAHDTFDPAGWNSRFGFGKLNIAAALQSIGAGSAPPTVQFSQGSYSVLETAGNVALTVNRTDSTAEASVDYATADTAGLTACNQVTGIASSRCDYANTVGTLRFAAGESSKTIFIPIVDDGYVEGNESFTISLSNAVGGSLGSPSTATLTIQDNDTTLTNPIVGVPFFVRQQYIDFLGREPDPVGFQGWQNILNNCPPSGKDSNGNFCDRIEVSAGFFRSPEFQDRGSFIFRFYSASLGRNPFYAEFMPDLAKVSGFLTDAQLEANKVAFVQEFMSRTEFQNKYGALSDAAFKNALVQTAGVDPGISFPDTKGTTRAQFLRQFIDSPAVYNKFYNQSFVVMQYFGYLRRDPDASYTTWIQTMNANSADYRTMINGFINSNEYVLRFGP